jgi:hypothetical protein
MEHTVCEVEGCVVKSKGSDFHLRCLYHLGLTHDMHFCPICKAMPKSTWKGRFARVKKWGETGSLMSKDTYSKLVASSKRPGEVQDPVSSVKKLHLDPSQAPKGAEGFTFGVLSGSVTSNQSVKVIPKPNVVASGDPFTVLSIPGPNVVAPGGQSKSVVPQPKVVAVGGRSVLTGTVLSKGPVSSQHRESQRDLGSPVVPSVADPKLFLEGKIADQCAEILAAKLKPNESLRKLGRGMFNAPNSAVGIGWREFQIDPNSDPNSGGSVISDFRSAPDIHGDAYSLYSESIFNGAEGHTPPEDVLSQQEMEYECYQYERDVVLPPGAELDVGSFVEVPAGLARFTPLNVGPTGSKVSPVHQVHGQTVPVPADPVLNVPVVPDNISEEKRVLQLVKTLLDNRKEVDERRLDSRMEVLINTRLQKQQEEYYSKLESMRSESQLGQNQLQRSLNLLLERQAVVPSAALGAPKDREAMPPPPPPPAPRQKPFMVSIPNPLLSQQVLSYEARDKVSDWIEHGSQSKGSQAGDDQNEPEVVKLSSEQIGRFNDWVDVIFDTVKGLPRDQVVEDDQSSLWPHMKDKMVRTTVPLHNQVIDILQKAWKDPRKVRPYDSEAFALFKIKDEHHELFTQSRTPDRFVALSVKGTTSDKVLSSSFPKLLTKNFSSTVAIAAGSDFAANSLALKMANYQALSTSSCQSLLKDALDMVVDPAVKETLAKLDQGLGFIQATGFYQADLASRGQVRSNSLRRAAWLEEADLSKTMKASLLAMPMEVAKKLEGEDHYRSLLFGSSLESGAKDVAEALKVKKDIEDLGKSSGQGQKSQKFKDNPKPAPYVASGGKNQGGVPGTLLLAEVVCLALVAVVVVASSRGVVAVVAKEIGIERSDFSGPFHKGLVE